MEAKKNIWSSPILRCVLGLLFLTVRAAIAQSVPSPCDPRGLYPGQFVYDDKQQVCWLADANLAGKPGMRALFNVSGINPNGTMNFDAARNWVAALNDHAYLGHSDWQIPATPLNDSTCSATGTGGGSFATGCTGSAMGSLYHDFLGLHYPESVAPGFGVPVSPFFQNAKLSYYWTKSPSASGGQEVFTFSNSRKGGVTTTFPFYYAFPMIEGALPQGAPACPPGAGVVPYTSGAAAYRAVYDCVTGNTWVADGNLAARRHFKIRGDVVIVSNRNKRIVARKIEDGAMLYDTATQWIGNMQTMGYLNSTAWDLPPDHTYVAQFAADLGLAPGDSRLQFTGKTGPFQDLQPFYYWGCQQTGSGLIESPCTAYAPPSGANQMQWTFNFDDGFTGTAETIQQFFVMVYFPVSQACSNPITCCIRAGGNWSGGHCE